MQARTDTRHGERGQDNDDDADRHIDVECPPPRQVICEQAAEQRADHRRDSEHGAQCALVLAAFTQWDDVGDDRHRSDHQQPSSEALHGTPADQPLHALREPAQC
jgi:hypothetical protein